MKKNTEVEAKLQVLDPEELQQLRTEQVLPDGYMLGDPTSDAVRDLYVDTPDAKLLRHGYALRIRQRNDKRIIGLKSLIGTTEGGVHTRAEIEGPLQCEPPAALRNWSAWPSDVRNTVREFTVTKVPLTALCEIKQARDVRLVYETRDVLADASNQPPVAEMSLDAVQAYAGPGERDPILQFSELEIEWTGATGEEALPSLVEHLIQNADLRPVQLSKLERALRAASARLPGMPLHQHGIQPDMHMADACRLLWRVQLFKMMGNEAGVRNDSDPEFVHDMRVAIRRMRAAYVLFGAHFQRKQVRDYVNSLRCTARLLGAVRDLDVALGKLARYQRDLPPAERDALAPLATHWAKKRDKPRAALLKWLDSADYASFLEDFLQFCKTPGAAAKKYRNEPGAPPSLTQVRHVLPSGNLSRFEAVRRYEIVFERDIPVPIETLHALRIDCKYLRYILEFSRDLIGDDGRHLISQLKRLQDHLGDLNDAAVALDMLQQLPDGLQNATVEQYIAHQCSVMAELSESASDAFYEFVAAPNRHCLADAIAQI